MKIGITCYPTYGGSGVVATELGMKLATMGHNIHFIAYALPYRLSNFTGNVFFHEVDVLRYPLFEYPPYSLSLAHKMAEVIEFEKLDILHVHYAIPHATSAFLAKQIIEDKNFKFVTTLHGTDITLIGADPSYKKMVEFSIEKSDGVTAVSQYLSDKTYDTFSIKKEIEVIPNFVPDNFLKLNRVPHKSSCFKKNDEFVLTHISNFRPVKRVMDLVYIMEKLIPRYNVRLLMVGDGPDRSKMEQLCREKGLCDKITFLGKQENVEDVLVRTDLFILPSAEESFGLVLLEAFACGIPCVTSNVGGIPEVNIHGETGYAVEPGNINAFAEHIEILINDRDLYLKMSKNTLDLARVKFNSDSVVPKYVDYYNKILS